MDNSLYSARGQRINYSTINGSIRDLLSLSESVQNGHWKHLSDTQLTQALCNDLKAVLEHEELYVMIDQLFALESSISQLAKLTMSRKLDVLSSFDRIFKRLSPLMLRALCEVRHDNDIDQFLHHCKEAIQVGMEEELYLLQDKLL